MLQLVLAKPNANEEIKKLGGLAELTGAVARQAHIMPDPVDDWLAGIAGDTGGLAGKHRRRSAQRHLARRCAAVLPERRSTTAIPSPRSSTIDVNVADFAKLFGPGGLIDAFTNDHLIGYVDTSHAAVEMAGGLRASTRPRWPPSSRPGASATTSSPAAPGR